MGEAAPLLRVEGVSKSFGVTRALVDVGLELGHGQVLGLVGENGSGKSTMGTIIAAIQPADNASMQLDGMAYAPRTSVEASGQGVCMILQENGIFEDLTVAKNIFIGKETLFRRFGFLNIREMNRQARQALEAIEAGHIDENMLAGRLSFEDKKLVELARAMWGRPKILIADETTTALGRAGRSILYGIINKMKAENKSVIFISHDIDELIDKCDRLAVLRDGHYVASLDRSEFEPQKIKSLMVGRKAVDNFYRSDKDSCHNPEVVMRVKKVCTPLMKDISFELHRGEILGFGGLVDCGIHEIGRLVFGLADTDSGTVSVENGTMVMNPRQAMAAKIGYMSKNRDGESLMVASSIRDNICLPSYNKLKWGGLVNPGAEKRFVDALADELEIKMRDSGQFVLELSGGNKQKVVIAKCLGFGADILVMDCPTRGIDIGVKANIYDLMNQLKAQGKSIILISEDLPELIGMSDRILIMRDGKINSEFLREDDLTELELINHMV